MIYGLIDPVTRLVRYVGCSSRGLARPRQHARPRELRARTWKANWIASLLREGLTFEITVLEASSPERLKADERWWIAYGRASGWPLTNLTDGGDGTLGYRPTPETRAKTSARFKGRVFSAEHLEKIAAKARGRKASAETREKLRQAHLGKHQTAETIAKRAASVRGRQRPSAPGPALRINLRPAKLPRPPISDETRKRMRAAKLGKRQAPEAVAARTIKLTGKKRTPEQLARRANARRPRSTRDRCKNGHEMTPDNTRRRKGHGVECWTCHREACGARRRRAREFGIMVKRPPRAHCRAGHPFTDENTYRDKQGAQVCRICKAEWARCNRAKKGTASADH